MSKTPALLASRSSAVSLAASLKRVVAVMDRCGPNRDLSDEELSEWVRARQEAGWVLRQYDEAREPIVDTATGRRAG